MRLTVTLLSVSVRRSVSRSSRWTRSQANVNARSLWTARSLIGNEADHGTIISKLESMLDELRDSGRTGDQGALIFALSKHLPGDVLEKALRLIHSDRSPFRTKIGCLSESTASADGSSPLFALAASSEKHGPATAFMSVEGDEHVAIGRQISGNMDAYTEQRSHEPDDPLAALRSQPWRRQVGLPAGLEQLQTQPDSVNSVFTISAGSPQSLIDTLRRTFPRARTAGFIAAATPFVTGRPSTLFYNGQTLSTGTVGLALAGPKSAAGSQSATYRHLTPLNEPIRADSVTGNIINHVLINDEPISASKELLAALRAASHQADQISAYDDREGSTYVGIYSTPPDRTPSGTDELSAIFPVIAGGTSKGSLALDTKAHLPDRPWIQFFFRYSDGRAGVDQLSLGANNDSHAFRFDVRDDSFDEVPATDTASGSGRVDPSFVVETRGAYSHPSSQETGSTYVAGINSVPDSTLSTSL